MLAPRVPQGVGVREGDTGLELAITWRSPSLARNALVALVALAALVKGLLSALGPEPGPIQAGVCLIGMWWPVAHLVNRTRVHADANQVSFVQRPIPLMGAREYAWKHVASFRADGRDVRVQLVSGETERCTRVPNELQARFVADTLNTYHAGR